LRAEEVRWQSQPYSITLTLPPLAVVILRPDRPTSTDQTAAAGTTSGK